MVTPKKRGDHVVLIAPSTLACLHCGEHYVMTMPAPVGILAAASKAFSKDHDRHKLRPDGRACAHCFGFGHVETDCPRTEYGASFERWLNGPDTGTSSQALCRVLTGLSHGDIRHDYPLDPSDFGRCLRFLDAFPALRSRIVEMAYIGPVWKRMAAAWPELEALYREEVPKHSGPAPKLYARMKELRGPNG